MQDPDKHTMQSGSSDNNPPEGESALEDGFPFEDLAPVAEIESWRKEVSRPIYHTHKWWAQRLGSVFRAIIIASTSPKNAHVMDLFYSKTRIPNKVIFDPFMGSGTTVGESLKLGARAIGRDINPVAYFVVKNALKEIDKDKVVRVFSEMEEDTAPILRSHYRSRNDSDVLYYFWVKTAECPNCKKPLDLFSSRVFASHAYPGRHPDAKSICPNCCSINDIRYTDNEVMCTNCGASYNPKVGNASGSSGICPNCQTKFSIARTYLASMKAPSERMYAKLILDGSNKKSYEAIDDFDLDMYRKAVSELKDKMNPYPKVAISPGYNTKQILNYGYTHWHQLFNERQLLCLSILAKRIGDIEDRSLRELFTVLFSGVLEFNNMFASFKGEGTGAVRHMFSHHILKPERAPLEANLWGTPKSSGSFSTLFRSRILRALEYRENPFELRPVQHEGKIRSSKVFDISQPLGCPVASSFKEFKDEGLQLYLSCGDSSRTDIESESVDLVVTDPPFFDNVHYSELADFFYVWMRHILGEQQDCFRNQSTRMNGEVQNADSELFSGNLETVFRECNRVLKKEGRLIFTYHHSRQEGWQAVLQSVLNAGFVVTFVQPTKSEMSATLPKRQAKEPIDIDVVLVCRKFSTSKQNSWRESDLEESLETARKQIVRMDLAGRRMSRNDIRVIIMGQIIRTISLNCDGRMANQVLREIEPKVEEAIRGIHSNLVTASKPQ